MYSVALVMAFHAAESENRPLEDLPRADFGRVPEKISFVGEEKTTPIVVFVMIQRIFTSWALAPTLFTIFIRRLSILLLSFIMKVDFSCQ